MEQIECDIQDIYNRAYLVRSVNESIPSNCDNIQHGLVKWFIKHLSVDSTSAETEVVTRGVCVYL